MPKTELISTFKDENQRRLGTQPGPKELSLKPSKDLAGVFNATDLYRGHVKDTVTTRDRENAGAMKTAGRGLIRGGLNTMSAIGGAINLGGDILKKGGAETIGEELSFIGENTSDYYSDILKEHPEWQRPDRFSHESFFENFLESPLSYSLMVLSENAPMIASMLIPAGAAGVGARAIGGSANAINAARIAAGSVGIGGLEAGASYDELMQSGVDPRDAMGIAVNTGIINGALETIPLAILFNNPVGRKIKSRIGKLILAEAGTEGLQTFNENLQKRAYSDPGSSLGEGILESMYAAALFAPILGWAGTDLQKADRRKQAKTPEQQAIDDTLRRDIQKNLEGAMSLEDIKDYEDYSPNAPDGEMDFQKNLLTGAELAKRGIKTTAAVQEGFEFMRQTGMDFELPINESEKDTSLRRPFYQAIEDAGQPKVLKARIEGGRVYPSKSLAQFDLAVQENKGEVPKGQLVAEERADGWQIVPATFEEPLMMEPAVQEPPAVPDQEIQPITNEENAWADHYEKYVTSLPEEQQGAARESIRAALEEAEKQGTQIKPDTVIRFIDEIIKGVEKKSPPPEVVQAETPAPETSDMADEEPVVPVTHESLYEQAVKDYGKEKADEVFQTADNIGKMQKTTKDVTALDDLPADEKKEITSFLDVYGDDNDAVKMRFDGKSNATGVYSFTPYGEDFDGDSFSFKGKPTFDKIQKEYEATAKRFGKKPWQQEGEADDQETEEPVQQDEADYEFQARYYPPEGGQPKKQPIKGAKFYDERTDTTLIVHRDITDNKRWNISEASTGLSVTGGIDFDSELDAIEHVNEVILGERTSPRGIEEISEQAEKFLEAEKPRVEKPDPREALARQRDRGETVRPEEKSVKPKKGKKAKKPESVKPEKSGKPEKVIGKNVDGAEITIDKFGARSIPSESGNLQITEPIGIVPGKEGFDIPTVEERYARGRTEFLTAEEFADMEAKAVADEVGEGPEIVGDTGLTMDELIETKDMYSVYAKGLESKLKNNKQLGLKAKNAINKELEKYDAAIEEVENAIDNAVPETKEQAPPRDKIELQEEWKGVSVEIPIKRDDGSDGFVTRDGYEAVSELNDEITTFDQILDCLSG